MTDRPGQLDLIDVAPLATVADRRAALAEVAGRVMEAIALPNTARAFRQDWRAWSEFVIGMDGGVELEEPSAHSLALFAVWLAQGGTWLDGRRRDPAAPATIKRRLTGVQAGWRKRGRTVPQGVSGDARKVVEAFARDLAQQGITLGRGQAPGLTMSELHQIASTTPNTLAGYRDKALIMVGFGIAARASELANLLVGDIEYHPDRLTVHIRTSKTGKSRHPVVNRARLHPESCAVAAWKRWQESAALLAGPAFRVVNKADRVGSAQPLSPYSVSVLVTQAGRRAGLSRRITCHSLRRGLATESRAAGNDLTTIAKQGGWSGPHSAALQGYVTIVDSWRDNATVGLAW